MEKYDLEGGGYLSISTPEILIEQTYKEEEYDDHFNDMLPAFKDPRYIKIDNKPIFIIYDPKAFDARRFMDRWQELAANNGIGRIYFMGFSSGVTGSETHKILEMGFDAVGRQPRFGVHSDTSYARQSTECASV